MNSLYPRLPGNTPELGPAGSQTPAEPVPGSGINNQGVLRPVSGCEQICPRLSHSLSNPDTSRIKAVGLSPSLKSELVHSSSPWWPRRRLWSRSRYWPAPISAAPAWTVPMENGFYTLVMIFWVIQVSRPGVDGDGGSSGGWLVISRGFLLSSCAAQLPHGNVCEFGGGKLM